MKLTTYFFLAIRTKEKMLSENIAVKYKESSLIPMYTLPMNQQDKCYLDRFSYKSR